MNKIRIKDINFELKDEVVELTGWVKKLRRLGELVFIDIRDIGGIIQLVANSKTVGFKIIENLNNQDLIQVVGTLKQRKNINPNLINGNLEIIVNKLELISTSKLTPFIIEDETDALESKRMQYRYLDIRRPAMQKILLFRSNFYKSVREFLYSNNFNEIETPYITSPTVGGASELEVHSINLKDKYYALAQSPQIYKQLLMIGGMDRYFQIAKCFRDEKSRSDRQMEFTQLDLEMSFVNREDVIDFSEKLIKKVFSDLLNINFKEKFPIISYKMALEKYGSDKPDIRFDNLINDATLLFKDTDIEFIKNRIKISKLRYIKFDYLFSNKQLKQFSNFAKQENNSLFWIINEQGKISSSINPIPNKIINNLDLLEGQTALFSFDNLDALSYPEFLGRLRLIIGAELNLINKSKFDFAWIIDFPLFEIEDGKINSAHNPFTKPNSNLNLSNMNIEQIKNLTSMSYDLVLNGSEVGGGSIRITDSSVQTRIFELMNYNKDTIEKYFGFFIESLNYGTPPHGGIAFGVDRLISIMLNKDSIRDVIAFPKSSHGTDEMSKGPFEKINERKKR